MPLESLKTPCIGLCEMSEWWGICLGCGRRIEEIMDWVYMTDQEREIARGERELRDAKMERDILKKAISIFSRSDGKSTNL